MELLTIPETVARVRAGRSTVYLLIASGELESVKIGRLRRVPVDAVDDYLRRLRSKNTRAAA